MDYVKLSPENINKEIETYKENIKNYELEAFLKKQKEPLTETLLYLLNMMFNTGDLNLYLLNLEINLEIKSKIITPNSEHTSENIYTTLFNCAKEIIGYDGPDYPIKINTTDRVGMFCIIPTEDGHVLKTGNYKGFYDEKQPLDTHKIIGDVFRFVPSNEQNGARFVLIPVEDSDGNKLVFWESQQNEIKVEELLGYCKEAGEFNVTNKLMVSDPCYSVGTWCQTILEDVKNGTWKGEAHIGMTGWYIRTWYLRAYHKDIDHEEYPASIDWEAEGYEQLEDVGVDAGTMTIFNYDDYVEFRKPMDTYDRLTMDGRDPWYEFCDVIPNHKDVIIYEKKGVVSSTGFGDGSYPVFIKKENGKIVDVIVEFIREYAEDDTDIVECSQDLEEDYDG